MISLFSVFHFRKMLAVELSNLIAQLWYTNLSSLAREKKQWKKELKWHSNANRISPSLRLQQTACSLCYLCWLINKYSSSVLRNKCFQNNLRNLKQNWMPAFLTIHLILFKIIVWYNCVWNERKSCSKETQAFTVECTQRRLIRRLPLRSIFSPVQYTWEKLHRENIFNAAESLCWSIFPFPSLNNAIPN